MHGLIFVLSEELTDDNILSEEEIFDLGPKGIDYITESENPLEDAITFSKDYGVEIKEVEKEKFVFSGKKFREALLKERKQRIQSIKEYLNQEEEKIDLWQVSMKAWPIFEDIFVYDGVVCNSMDLLDFLSRNTSLDKMYILKIYDYHC